MAADLDGLAKGARQTFSGIDKLRLAAKCFMINYWLLERRSRKTGQEHHLAVCANLSTSLSGVCVLQMHCNER